MRLVDSIRCATVFLAAPALAAAQGAGSEMYRCPGNDYRNTICAKVAATLGCKRIEGTPITVFQAPRPRAPAAPANRLAVGTPVPASGTAPADARVDATAQRARDTDARRILETELRTEEERMAALQKEYNNGDPERLGSERNFQRYAERVAEMKAAIARKEGDIAAIRRELQKLAR
jgi:hypothetical protein